MTCQKSRLFQNPQKLTSPSTGDSDKSYSSRFIKREVFTVILLARHVVQFSDKDFQYEYEYI